MKQSEIDTSEFRAHWTRSASNSKAKAKGLSCKEILAMARWKKESTFRRHYLREIACDITGSFQATVLKKVWRFVKLNFTPRCAKGTHWNYYFKVEYAIIGRIDSCLLSCFKNEEGSLIISSRVLTFGGADRLRATRVESSMPNTNRLELGVLDSAVGWNRHCITFFFIWCLGKYYKSYSFIIKFILGMQWIHDWLWRIKYAFSDAQSRTQSPRYPCSAVWSRDWVMHWTVYY